MLLLLGVGDLLRFQPPKSLLVVFEGEEESADWREMVESRLLFLRWRRRSRWAARKR